MLVLIDGEACTPAGRGRVRAGDQHPARSCSSRATRNYLHLFDGWMQTEDLNRSWTVAQSPPKTLAKAQDAAVQGGTG